MAVSVRKQIAQNKRNTILILIIFVAIMCLIGWAFAALNHNPSVLIVFAIIATGYAAFQYFFSDKIAIASAGAKETNEKDQPRLFKVVKKLSEEAHIPMPRVYIINDSAPNAFATGRDPKHACVAATTGLLEVMDDHELLAVMGHELSHVKNYDILISTVAFGLVSLIGLIADFGLRVLWYSDRDEEENSPVGMLFVLVTLILSPIVATIVQLAVSRQREYLADASSANLINSPESMISALRKLDTHARPMHQQNVATEALFIANPLNKSFLSKLFSTHPPIESRIERLENVQK